MLTFEQAELMLGRLTATLAQIMHTGHRLCSLTQMSDSPRWHASVEADGRFIGFGTGKTAAEAILRAAQACGPDDKKTGRGAHSAVSDTPEHVIAAAKWCEAPVEDIFG